MKSPLIIQDLYESLLNPSLSESELLSCLKEIKKNFTTNRRDLSCYHESINHVSSYAAFYLPTNFPKLKFILDLLPMKIKKEMEGCDFYDIGTGPGTYLLAWQSYFEKEVMGKLVGVDTSPLMLNQAKRFQNSFYPQNKIEFNLNIDDINSIRSESILFFGNSLNEIGPVNTLKIINKFQPKFVFFIALGTPLLFDFILGLRKTLKRESYQCLYPCLNSSLDCPLEGDTNNWCHQILRISHDPKIERISQILKLNRNVLPLISHLYVRNEIDFSKSEKVEKGRIIRYLGETKFSFSWELCVDLESKLKVVKVELLKKYLTSEEIKKINRMRVGECLFFVKDKELKPLYWRVKAYFPTNWP